MERPRRRYAARVRRAAFAIVLLLAGCGSAGAPAPSGPADAATLTLDLFPFGPASSAFVNVSDSSMRTVRVEPEAGGAGARILTGAAGGDLSEILRVTRQGDALSFAEGAVEGTVLLRAGARPGDSWESGGWRVRFDGWERVSLPQGGIDAARITARRGPPTLERVETWWFAKGAGLVRLRNDHGKLYVDEIVRAAP